MGNILNKIIILAGSVGIILLELDAYEAIIAISIGVGASSLMEYFNNQLLSRWVFLIYSLLSAIYLPFLFFLPLIAYDLFRTDFQLMTLLAAIPYALHFTSLSSTSTTTLFIVFVIVYLLKARAMEEIKLRENYIQQRDYLTEVSLSLEEKINELTIKQDIDVNLATLNERNRISREIHDNVGHLLSSSILQIGAIMAVSQEENTKKSLEIVKETLNEGMNSIRDSVHNLHNTSIDLYQEIEKIVNNFTFCKVKFTYDISEDMPANAKYSIIAIVKEGLSNVIKHSNCDFVSISLYEHPKLYQLIIYDNGTQQTHVAGATGMGIESIRQRVAALNGIMNIDQSRGFKIFISFMKG